MTFVEPLKRIEPSLRTTGIILDSQTNGTQSDLRTFVIKLVERLQLCVGYYIRPLTFLRRTGVTLLFHVGPNN